MSTTKKQFALVYLMNIGLFSRAPEEHLHHVQHVLTFFSNAKGTLKRKFKTSKTLTDPINYLGHVISPGGCKIPSNTTDAICELKARAILMKLLSFLALCNVFRRVVTNFARLSAPLSKR